MKAWGVYILASGSWQLAVDGTGQYAIFWEFARAHAHLKEAFQTLDVDKLGSGITVMPVTISKQEPVAFPPKM